MKTLNALAIGSILFTSFYSSLAPASGVDLHAHLFMNRGLGFLFSGSFGEPLAAQDWKSRFRSQANSEGVLRSELDILVVALYAHPLFSTDLRESIRAQIRDARSFVRDHPSWTIATTPQEAQAALNQKKQVLVFSLEGAAGVLESEEDIREFVDREGIRIVTFFHLTDDHLGGAALLDGLRAFASPLGLLRSLLTWNFDSQGTLKNTQGISEAGKKLLSLLLAHRVWIDLAHVPDQAFTDLLPILAQANQPLLFTHTSMRRHKKMERSISEIQLEALSKTGGILGLMPSVEMLGEPTPGKCEAGIHPFAKQFHELTQRLPLGAVAVGSDFNGGIYHLPGNAPECGHEALPIEGFWNIGQFPEFWADLRRQEQDTPPLTQKNEILLESDAYLRPMTEHFLAAWSQVHPQPAPLNKANR